MKKAINILSSLIFNIAIVLIIAVAMGCQEPLIPLLIGSAITFAGRAFNIVTPANVLMFVMTNVEGDPDNAKKTGKQIKAKMWYLHESQWDDTLTFPTRSNLTRSTIPLKSGEYWHYLGAVYDSPQLKWSASENEIASLITKELTFILGGMETDVLYFLENGIGKRFFVVFEICSTGTKYLMGNGCKPVKLSAFEGGSMAENTSTTVTFKAECGEILSIYSGTITLEAAATVAANATTIALTSNPGYQLTSGTDSAATITDFTGVTTNDVGRFVTIYGSGGSYPSIITDANDFILAGGEQWTANAGAQITFMIYKDASSDYKFIEQSRAA